MSGAHAVEAERSEKPELYRLRFEFDSPEVLAVFGENMSFYYEEYYENLAKPLAKAGLYSANKPYLISPEGMCAVDVLERYMIEALYGEGYKGIDTRHIRPVAFLDNWPSNEDEARARADRFCRNSNTPLQEGVNLFILPAPKIERASDGSPQAVVPDPERWTYYILYPPEPSEGEG